jgi:hypothetical protein
MLPTVETCSCSYGAHTRAPSFRNHPLRLLRSRNSRTTSRSERRATRLLASLSPDQLHHALLPYVDHLFLAYERVVMPCHNMNCGDVVHRRLVTTLLLTVLRCDEYSIVVLEGKSSFSSV